MSIHEIAGYSCAVLIGVSLGLIGGGGSILTVPILVYLLHVPPMVATGYSLFIVGSTSLVGAYRNYLRGTINIAGAVTFAIPSLMTVFVTRFFLLSALPPTFTVLSFTFSKDLLIMLAFAAIMLLVSVSMIRDRKPDAADGHTVSLKGLLWQGVLVGLVSGFIGAGGGFLIIPALVMFSKLPIKTAIGTSLLIIGINSLIGFSGDLLRNAEVNWLLLLLFSGISVGGIFIGNAIGHRLPGKALKPAFGWFVLAMGIYIVCRELFAW